VEQEGIEIEQQWEGLIWKLRQATEQLYQDFDPEFSMAKLYPAPPTSVASSQYESTNQPGDKSLDVETEEGRPPAPLHAAGSVASSASFKFESMTAVESDSASQHSTLQSPLLLGMDTTESRQPEIGNSKINSDISDLDSSLAPWGSEDSTGLPESLPKGRFAGIELYPHLLADFGSRRDRINKWLEHAILLSPVEATYLLTILKERLAIENKKLPSNWSQLVIAYWELDGAADPQAEHP